MYRPPDKDDDAGEEPMNKHTKRRKRRRANSVVKNGKEAVRAHRRIGGRTGAVQSKKTHGNRSAYSSKHPNPPGPTEHNLGA